MYETFFRLQKNPFTLTADPAFLFLTPQHREALAGMTYAILAHKGLVVLTGDAGTGKTTLLERALQQLPAERLQSSVILNPTLNVSEFLEMALLDFGISEVPPSKAQRLWILQDLLLRNSREGRTVALIVDEAHKLSPLVLEEIRLLGNFEAAEAKLLQLVLIGQPELSELLNQQNLRQFKQRIAVRLSIHPLSRPEIHEYIQHRWKKAGGGPAAPFRPEAVNVIAQWSQGIPRLINSICDNSLLLAFGGGEPMVTPDHVRVAVADLDLPAGSFLPAVAPVPATARPAAKPAPAAVVERPAPEASKLSMLGRWAGRLGFVHQNGKI